MRMNPKVVAVISAFNEGKYPKQLLKLIEKTRKEVSEVIFIDDGSTDDTPRIIKPLKVILHQNHKNRGKGYSLRKGFKTAFEHSADIIVTLDADGEHDPSEIGTIIKPILQGNAKIVIGSRFYNKNNWANDREIRNLLAVSIVNKLIGLNLTDCTCGFRAFDTKYLKYLNLNADGFGIETELILLARLNNIDIIEVPIKNCPNLQDRSGCHLNQLISDFISTVIQYATKFHSNPVFLYELYKIYNAIHNREYFEISSDIFMNVKNASIIGHYDINSNNYIFEIKNKN